MRGGWQFGPGKKIIFFSFRLARPHFSHIPSFMKQHAGASRVVLMPLGGGGRWSRVRPPPCFYIISRAKIPWQKATRATKENFYSAWICVRLRWLAAPRQGHSAKREGGEDLFNLPKRGRSLDFKGEKETCSSFTQLFRGKKEGKPTTFAWESGRGEKKGETKKMKDFFFLFSNFSGEIKEMLLFGNRRKERHFFSFVQHPSLVLPKKENYYHGKYRSFLRADTPPRHLNIVITTFSNRLFFSPFKEKGERRVVFLVMNGGKGKNLVLNMGERARVIECCSVCPDAIPFRVERGLAKVVLRRTLISPHNGHELLSPRSSVKKDLFPARREQN